jgi:hypothetical protein
MSVPPDDDFRQFAQSSDEELKKMADAADSLTEPARAALKAELNRRHIEFPLAAAHEISSDIDGADVVILRKFRDIPVALLAKSILDSAKIECFLTDVNTIRMDWLWSNAVGGVKLLVKKVDVAAAQQLLDQERVDAFEVDGVGHFSQPICPQCESLEVSFKGLNKTLAYGSIALGVPFPASHLAWHCNVCGHVWEDPSEPRPEHEENPERQN